MATHDGSDLPRLKRFGARRWRANRKYHHVLDPDHNRRDARVAERRTSRANRIAYTRIDLDLDLDGGFDLFDWA